MHTRLHAAGGAIHVVGSHWVVDATGHRRALLGTPMTHGPRRSADDALVEAVGLEWLVALPLPLWQHWADALSFCLGSDWVPEGYGWVFPMTPGRLKIGVCRYANPDRSQPSLLRLQQTLVARLQQAGWVGSMRVLDRHGGRVASSVRRREPHLRDGVIGVGDAVSTANLLGGEGIRHALTSSEVLAPLLLEQLERDRRTGARPEAGPLRRYPRRLRGALGWRWPMSGRIARAAWARLHGVAGNQRLERVLQGLEVRDAEDLSALFFDYRFERYGLRSLPYALGWRRS
jgi:flavin-dependent dehydrogenase